MQPQLDKKDGKYQVLYISYNGALEEIVPSQVIPYLRELSKQDYSFTLLTFEKKQDLNKAGPEYLKSFKEKLKIIGIDWHWLPYHKRPSLLATSLDVLLGSVYASYLVVSRRIRLVHARSVIPAVMSLVTRFFGAEFIFDTRGLLAEEYVGGGHWKEGGLKYNITKFFEKLCLKSTKAVIVLTQLHREYLLDLSLLEKGNKSAIVEIIPCCVDLSRFRYDSNDREILRKRENLQDSFVFTYLGKVGKHYMFKELLDFVNIAFKALPSSKLMIISQSRPQDIFKIALSQNVDTRRIIMKQPSYEEIPYLLSLANAGVFFINPYKKFGSSPIKLGEFLSCGIPVIINSGVGETERLVNTNRVGVVIKRFEAEDYKHTLAEFLELIGEKETLFRRCRKTAEDCLSLGLGVKKYLSIYNRIYGKCIA